VQGGRGIGKKGKGKRKVRRGHQLGKKSGGFCKHLSENSAKIVSVSSEKGNYKRRVGSVGSFKGATGESPEARRKKGMYRIWGFRGQAKRGNSAGLP